MANRKLAFVEEIMLPNNQIAQRQSDIYYDDETGSLVRPDDRLTEQGQAEWNQVMGVLDNLGLSHIVDGFGLLDHCRAVQEGRPIRQRGQIG